MTSTGAPGHWPARACVRGAESAAAQEPATPPVPRWPSACCLLCSVREEPAYAVSAPTLSGSEERRPPYRSPLPAGASPGFSAQGDARLTADCAPLAEGLRGGAVLAPRILARLSWPCCCPEEPAQRPVWPGVCSARQPGQLRLLTAAGRSPAVAPAGASCTPPHPPHALRILGPRWSACVSPHALPPPFSRCPAERSARRGHPQRSSSG